MTLTNEQLRILRHMLGIDDRYMPTPKPWRDYYCANPDDQAMLELAKVGAVTCYAKRDSYDWFRTTDDGRAAALRSHRTIRYSKAKRVYAKFLNVSDCYPDLTFRQFLTDPQFSETRREA